jgi:hypothetical protein
MRLKRSWGTAHRSRMHECANACMERFRRDSSPRPTGLLAQLRINKGLKLAPTLRDGRRRRNHRSESDSPVRPESAGDVASVPWPDRSGDRSVRAGRRSPADRRTEAARIAIPADRRPDGPVPGSHRPPVGRGQADRLTYAGPTATSSPDPGGPDPVRSGGRSRASPGEPRAAIDLSQDPGPGPPGSRRYCACNRDYKAPKVPCICLTSSLSPY